MKFIKNKSASFTIILTGFCLLVLGVLVFHVVKDQANQKQADIYVNKLLKVYKSSASDDPDITSLSYRPIKKLGKSKIVYDVLTDNETAHGQVNEKTPGEIYFNDVESDDGYYHGFRYDFAKKRITFFYFESVEMYLEDGSIAEQVYSIDNNGYLDKLIKQKVRRGSIDDEEHRSKKDLLTTLDNPKHVVQYLEAKHINYYTLKKKVQKDVAKKAARIARHPEESDY